jgi:hypothetical protein
MKFSVFDHSCDDQRIREKNKQAEKCSNTQNNHKLCSCPVISSVTVAPIIKKVHPFVIVTLIHCGEALNILERNLKKQISLLVKPVTKLPITITGPLFLANFY